MLKGQGIFLGIFGVIFLVSTALGQPQPDSNSSNTTLSQSESVTIIQAIHAAELRTRDHIDKKSGELNTEITTLKTDLAVLNNEVNNLRWWLIALTTLVLIPLVFPGLKAAWQKWVKGDRTNGRHSPALREIQNFASSGGFSGTPHSENRDSAEGS